jgi:hypothetical protein
MDFLAKYFLSVPLRRKQKIIRNLRLDILICGRLQNGKFHAQLQIYPEEFSFSVYTEFLSVQLSVVHCV